MDIISKRITREKVAETIKNIPDFWFSIEGELFLPGKNRETEKRCVEVCGGFIRFTSFSRGVENVILGNEVPEKIIFRNAGSIYYVPFQQVRNFAAKCVEAGYTGHLEFFSSHPSSREVKRIKFIISEKDTEILEELTHNLE